MTPQALSYINGRLNGAGLNYHFARYNYGDGSPVYPYEVGTYSEADAVSEDGRQEATALIPSSIRRPILQASFRRFQRSRTSIK